MPFRVPTSVQLAVPVRRRRPCRFRLDDGLLGRPTAVPLPASTLPAPTGVALLVSTAVVPFPQPTSPSAASKATALVVRDTSGAVCRAASCADGRAKSTAVPFSVPTSVQLAVPVRRRRPCRFRLDDGLFRSTAVPLPAPIASCADCRGTTCVDGRRAAPSANVALGCIESDGSRRS